MNQKTLFQLRTLLYEGQSSKLILFLLLIILNFIVRIPSIPHEKGYDSFFIHSVANSISNYGVAKWWINWMSVFGLYPYSYASAVPFSLSGLSQLTGISMEHSILIFCIMLGFFSIFSAYLLGTIFFDKFIYRFIFSVVFSLSASTVELTTWNITTRAQFIVFLPLFLYLLFRSIYGSKKHLFFYIVVCIFLLATHHFVYIGLFYSALIVAIYAVFWLFDVDKVNNKINLSILYSLIMIGCFIFVFLFGSKIGFITSGSRYQWIIDVLIISLRNAGFVFLYFIGAFIYLLLKKEKVVLDWILLACLIPTFFLSFNQIYGYLPTFFFVCIIGTIGLSNLVSSFGRVRGNKILIYAFILFLILNVSFSTFFNHYKLGIAGGYEDWYMKDDTYETGNWIANHISHDKYAMSTGFESSRLFATYGGLPVMYSDDVNNFINGFITSNESNYIKNSFMSKSFYFDNPYVLKSGTTTSGLVNWIAQFPVTHEHVVGFIEGTNISYIYEDTYNYEPLYQSLPANKNMIFNGGRLRIWIY